MQPIIEFFQSGSVLALAVSFTIFMITVILVAKRFIGFMVTLLLLIFSIAAGYAVLNHDIVRKYFLEQTDEKIVPDKEKGSFSDQLQKTFEEIKKQLSYEKESLESVSESINHLFQQMEGQRKKIQSFLEEKKEEVSPLPEGDAVQETHEAALTESDKEGQPGQDQ